MAVVDSIERRRHFGVENPPPCRGWDPYADPKSTYWYYLTASPELLALAAARLEHAFGHQP